MRIWIVNPYDALPGESQRYGRYSRLTKVLLSRGHEVVWWTSAFKHRDKCFRTQTPRIEGLTVKLINALPYYRNISLARLRNHMQLARGFRRDAQAYLQAGQDRIPDRIIASVPPLGLPREAMNLGRRYGAKVILDVQDAWPEAFYRLIPGNQKWQGVAPFVLGLPRSYAQKLYSMADGISAVAQTYIDLTMAPSRGIPHLVTPIGVDLDQFDQVSRSANKGATTTTFVYLGSMSSNYDLMTVLLAVAELKTRQKPVRVLLAGKGEHEVSLRRAAVQLGLSDEVDFKGYLPYENAIALLRESHVALNPIRPESYSVMPNKVGDYCAAGLPIINSIDGELRALLDAEDAGVFYKAGDAVSLADAMATYIDNPRRIQEQGANSRRIAESLLDRQHTYPEFAEFIETLQRC